MNPIVPLKAHALFQEGFVNGLKGGFNQVSPQKSAAAAACIFPFEKSSIPVLTMEDIQALMQSAQSGHSLGYKIGQKIKSLCGK